MENDDIELSFHVGKKSNRSKKYLVYKNQQFEVDFNFLKNNSEYFYENRRQFKNILYINLINEEEDQIDIPNEAIQAFIASCHNEPCKISLSSVIPLQYLSHKFQFPELIRITSQFCNDHSEKLALKSLLFKTNLKSSSIETQNEEEIIATHMKQFLKNEEMLLLPVPVLDRIVRLYLNQIQNEEKVEFGEMTDFLFKILDKKGKDASILFNNIDFNKENSSVFKRLHNDYADKFDFNMFNSNLVQIATECASELEEKKEECSRLSFQIKELSEKHEIEMNNMKEHEMNEKEKMKDEIKRIKEENEKQLQISDQKYKEMQAKLKEMEEQIKSDEQKYKEMEIKLKDSDKKYQEMEKQARESEQKYQEIQNHAVETEKKYEEMQNSLKGLLKNIIINVIDLENFNKLNTETKEFIINEINNNQALKLENETTQETKGNKNLIQHILFFKSAFDILSTEIKEKQIQSLYASNISSRNEFIIECLNQNKFMNNITEHLYQKNMLNQIINLLLNHFDNFIIEIDIPSKFNQQIVKLISDIKKENNIFSQKILISLVINNYDFLKKIDGWKKIVNLCKINSPIKKIEGAAFEHCDSLSQIIIPSSVTSIEYSAFAGCHSLTQLTIPPSVTSIKYNAFSCCHSLTQLTIPPSVISIGEYAFGCCHSLKEIIIPSSVKSIGDIAFNYCDSLTKVAIPSSVTSVGSDIFINCKSLTQITIPQHVNQNSIGISSNVHVTKI